MNQGKSIFSQIMDFLPKHKFRQCVNRYGGNYRVRSFTCFDQFMCMAFAQLTYRESLRDIECCLRALDFRSDIWSLGKIFVEVLSANFEIPDFLAKIGELDVPEKAKVLFRVMLADDPDLRPASMAAVAVSLANIQERIEEGETKQESIIITSEYSSDYRQVFTRIWESINSQIVSQIPDTAQMFDAVYINLQSDNHEQWSNAVHSCRRILQSLADNVFSPQSKPRIKKERRGEKDKITKIKLGKDNYINRLMCFIDDNSASKTFKQITGSHLDFIGHRLDAVFKVAQKGSHSVITTREEAESCVLFTIMAVRDILSLKLTKSKESSNNSQKTEAH